MDGASCPISVSKSVNKDGMMFFVNTNAAKRNAGKLIETAIGNAFLMDEKPDVTTLESWAAHCMRNVRAQSHKIDVATMQLSCSIVTGIRDSVLKYAHGPQLNSELALVRSDSRSGTTNSSWTYYRTPTVYYQNVQSAEWRTFKESLFFVGVGGRLIRSDVEGTLLKSTDTTSKPFLLFPWKYSSTVTFSSPNPDTYVRNPTQKSTSGYKNYMNKQQFFDIAEGSLGTRLQKFYSYSIGTKFNIEKEIPFYFEAFYRYGIEYRYTDGGYADFYEGIGTLDKRPMSQTFSLPAPFEMTAPIQTEADSSDLNVNFIAAAYKIVGEVYLSVLENGKDFTCAVTKPHDRPQVTITNPKALKPFTGKEVVNITGSGATR